jgi:2-polyprenyl-3-methyl-5-hydroxy-6-metoxy-1,4-benzoquinol methylase
MNKSTKFWDRIAKNYDREEKKDRPVSINIVEKSKKYLKSSDTVLDFGCASGKISIEISKIVKSVHAIDTSAKMIEIANSRLDKSKTENINFAYTSIFDEKYEKASFDTLVCFYVLHLVDDPQKVMKRIDELLKPGGFFISATPCMGQKNSLLRMPINIAAKIGLVPKIKFFNVSELKDVISNGNFEIVETESLHKSGDQQFIVAKATRGF